jgi:hypothetical protein
MMRLRNAALSVAVVLLAAGAFAQELTLTGPETSTIGDTAADLVYTPVTPCRVMDTRAAGNTILAGNSTRSFSVTNATSIATQGGIASGGCGIPTAATAVMLNFVSVAPLGDGDLRITPFGTAMPNASVLNWIKLTGLNLANGIAVKKCNPATTTCTNDLTLQADVSSTHMVIDVLGYFQGVAAGRAVAYVSGTTLIPGSRGFSAVTNPATGVFCLVASATITQVAPVVSVNITGTGHAGATALFRSDSVGCTAGDLAINTFNAGVASNEVFTVFIP